MTKKDYQERVSELLDRVEELIQDATVREVINRADQDKESEIYYQGKGDAYRWMKYTITNFFEI